MIISTQFVNSLIMKSFNRIKEVETKLEKKLQHIKTNGLFLSHVR